MLGEDGGWLTRTENWMSLCSPQIGLSFSTFTALSHRLAAPDIKKTRNSVKGSLLAGRFQTKTIETSSNTKDIHFSDLQFVSIESSSKLQTQLLPKLPVERSNVACNGGFTYKCTRSVQPH